MDKKSYCIAWLMLLFVGSLHAQYRTTTYCNPVSYTHLDVYKRQILTWGLTHVA